MIIVLFMYRLDLYGSVILQKEHRLRVFENRLLRRIFGTKWDEKRLLWFRDERAGLWYPSSRF